MKRKKIKERFIPKVKYINVVIKDNQGTQIRSVDIPSSLEHMPLDKYCDFISWVLRIDKWYSELESQGDQFNPFDPMIMKAYISQMARAVQAFGIIEDPDELDLIPLGDYDEHIRTFLRVDNPDMINLDYTQETLLHIYHNLFAVCRKYEPRIFNEDMFFHLQGETVCDKEDSKGQADKE